ncbi:hypothetical protein L3X38_030536 [Prunus dulcis]|uniref:Transposase MuDR plant domain-containing protein n=1 Tax=Prunus dulcis TaxID=3755 RepID=A0AAD4VAG0_PRUDU|nr:hypothetical protein L3X38_030536 [Prunus dulcis]
MSMTEIDAMVKELGHEGLINYWYSIPGDSFDGGLVKLSEDTDVLDMLVFVIDTRVINIFLEHVLACRQEQFYSQVGSNIFIKLDDEFGTNTGVVIQELDDNYAAIVPVGKELNEDGLIDEASKQGKETPIVNNEENSDKGQEKPTQGCSDKGKGNDKDMSHRVKRAFGKKKKRCGSLRRTMTVHHKDKVVERMVDGVRIEFQRHSMILRSGRRLANAADFEDEDDDACDSENSDYMIPKNFSEDEDEDDRKDYAKYNSEEEVDKNWPKFNAVTDMTYPKFEIGMLFTNSKVFKAAVREYSILQNKNVVFIMNEVLKLKAVCEDPDCGWMIYASKMQHENTLQVKAYVGEHTCTQLWENHTVKSTWISKKYVDTLKSNP